MDPVPLRRWLADKAVAGDTVEMGATYDDARHDDVSEVRRHRTTIVLEARPDGTWHATQDGIDAAGHGATAAEAAADYCRSVADADE